MFHRKQLQIILFIVFLIIIIRFKIFYLKQISSDRYLSKMSFQELLSHLQAIFQIYHFLNQINFLIRIQFQTQFRILLLLSNISLSLLRFKQMLQLLYGNSIQFSRVKRNKKRWTILLTNSWLITQGITLFPIPFLFLRKSKIQTSQLLMIFSSLSKHPS